jgi:uncharacterized coiled-coil protein SlyX
VSEEARFDERITALEQRVAEIEAKLEAFGKMADAITAAAKEGVKQFGGTWHEQR